MGSIENDALLAEEALLQVPPFLSSTLYPYHKLVLEFVIYYCWSEFVDAQGSMINFGFGQPSDLALQKEIKEFPCSFY